MGEHEKRPLLLGRPYACVMLRLLFSSLSNFYSDNGVSSAVSGAAIASAAIASASNFFNSNYLNSSRINGFGVLLSGLVATASGHRGCESNDSDVSKLFHFR